MPNPAAQAHRGNAAATDASQVPHHNHVHLVGRLAAAPVLRELPSGDILVQFRLIVDRPPVTPSTGRRTPTIDTLDCAAWRKDIQRSLRSCGAGDLLEVDGALRRRFWRAGAGAASRSEVEVLRLKRRARHKP